MTDNSRGVRSALFRPPFVACVVVLFAAAVFAGPGVRWFKVTLRKDPVPLRRPLSELDKSALGEYEFIKANTIPPAVADALGAQSYIEWEFRDTSVKGTKNPLQWIRLLITYDTGKPSLVPHTPDWCYQGGGYKITKAENVKLSLPTADGDEIPLPLRVVTFEKTSVSNRDTPTVVYTFHCNGQFMCTRTDVRRKLGDPRDRGAYFCKIEVSFGSPRSKPRNAEREESIAAAHRFLGRLLPVLLAEHLPDREAVKRDGGSTEPAA